MLLDCTLGRKPGSAKALLHSLQRLGFVVALKFARMIENTLLLWKEIQVCEVYRFDMERRYLSKNKMSAALVNSITLFCLYPTKDITY
jgi:hypothetical protein